MENEKAQGRHLKLVASENESDPVSYGKPDRKTISRECNLCKKTFRTDNRFIRFCDRCKRSDDLFRFHESLPEAGSLKNIA